MMLFMPAFEYLKNNLQHWSLAVDEFFISTVCQTLKLITSKRLTFFMILAKTFSDMTWISHNSDSDRSNSSFSTWNDFCFLTLRIFTFFFFLNLALRSLFFNLCSSHFFNWIICSCAWHSESWVSTDSFNNWSVT